MSIKVDGDLNLKHMKTFFASSNFDCLLFGDKGVKIVKPEEGYPVRPTDVEIDDGDDEIEEYDENVLRKRRSSHLSKFMGSKDQA